MIRLYILVISAVLLVGCSDNTPGNTPANAPGSVPENAPGSSVAAGYELVETVTGSGDDIVIPYKKFVYDNGLTVLLHEDDSDPLVHVNITYHVGSAREEAQRSGFAHFFEHMMFQGSAHVGDDEHFQIVTEAGGSLNGSGQECS